MNVKRDRAFVRRHCLLSYLFHFGRQMNLVSIRHIVSPKQHLGCCSIEVILRLIITWSLEAVTRREDVLRRDQRSTACLVKKRVFGVGSGHFGHDMCHPGKLVQRGITTANNSGTGHRADAALQCGEYAAQAAQTNNK